MEKKFTLEYWIDDGWYVGRLKEIPGVFSQGESLEELKDNIREAYRLMMEDDPVIDNFRIPRKEIEISL
ncbi:MAG: type II toxin-antitoxin system HicB family antitoxin [Deltaproteobacteria bacterium]|nr:MAG: type II toxin-antitoxin system HicB family antitoxin [Deltaproteobacteria bacterium]